MGDRWGVGGRYNVWRMKDRDVWFSLQKNIYDCI